MKSIFISEDRKLWRKNIDFFRESYPQIELHCATDFEEAKDIAIHESPIVLLISEQEDIPGDLVQSVNSFTEDIGVKPLLLIGKKECSNEASQIQKGYSEKEFMFLDINEPEEVRKLAIKRLIEAANKNTSNPSEQKEDLTTTSLKSFYHFKVVPYDVFFKVYEGSFMTLIKKDQPFSEAVIQKLARRGIKDVYISKTAKLKHLQLTAEELINKISFGGKSRADLYSHYICAVSVIHETVREFGVTEFISYLVGRLINSARSEIKTTPRIEEFLNNLPLGIMDKGEQAILLLILNLKMAHDLQWKTEATLEKLSLASLVHDCFIKSEELTRIKDKSDPVYESLMNTGKNEFDQHIEKARELSEHFHMFPDFSFLVESHHTIPEKKYTNSLNSIDCLFVLNRRFVTEIVIYGYTNSGSAHALKNLEVLNQGKFKESLSLLKTYFSRV